MADYLKPDEIKAITDAVLRELVTGNQWDDVKGRTLEDFCSANQDALIEDLYEDDPRDRKYRPGMIDHVKTYDVLLGTHRADEIPDGARDVRKP